MKSVLRIMRRIILLAGYFFFYVKELVFANIQVAHDVMTIHLHMRPGVIAIPLDIKRDISLLVFSNLLTMTPGTLALDISTDRKVLYVHVLYLKEDPEKSRAGIKMTFEKKIKELLENG